jgi:hypothetical protein
MQTLKITIEMSDDTADTCLAKVKQTFSHEEEFDNGINAEQLGRVLGCCAIAMHSEIQGTLVEDDLISGLRVGLDAIIESED